MTVLVVTCNGLGDLFLAKDFEEADLHPLVQYGDAVIRDEEHLFKCLLPDEILRLVTDEFREIVANAVRESTGRASFVEACLRHRERIWSNLIRSAAQLPKDPAVICELIRADRIRTLRQQKETRVMAKKDENTEPKAETWAGHALTAKIRMGKDKDGKPFGVENNPKREGSKSHARFALYTDGMTIQSLRDAEGSMAADVAYDKNKGYITVED